MMTGLSFMFAFIMLLDKLPMSGISSKYYRFDTFTWAGYLLNAIELN